MRRIIGYNLVVQFPVDEQAALHYLPEGLTCDGQPSAMWWFQQHHVYGDPAEVATLDAESSSYSEVVVKIPAVLGDERGNYTVFGITDNPQFVAVARFHGIPQNPGRVFVTELHPGDAEYDRPRKDLNIAFKFDGVGCLGTGSVKLEEELDVLPFVEGPNFGSRKFFDDVTDRVLLDDLYAGWAADYTATNIWSATTTLDFRAPDDSPMKRLAPIGEAKSTYFFSRFSGQKPTRRIALNYIDPT